jgi:transposase-like protein
MSGKRYTEEFKIAAVKQVAERGHPASEVAARLRGEHSQPVHLDKALRRA